MAVQATEISATQVEPAVTVVINMIVMEVVIELCELSKQLLKEDTIPPMITCFKNVQ